MPRIKRTVTVFSLIFALAIPGIVSASADAPALPQLSIDSSPFTVSGLSAGGFAAVQLHVAYSNDFGGAAIFAGGPFGCAQGNLMMAMNQCMAYPSFINVNQLVRLTQDLARDGKIAPPARLKNGRVFIFAGTQDTTVLPDAAKKLEEFYRSFMPASQIESVLNVPAAHGQPTFGYGGDCATLNPPYVIKCGYDGAGHALEQLYGELQPPASSAPAGNLTEFDQSPFNQNGATLAPKGYIYIPTACRDGQTACRLHVSLHGCHQGPGGNSGDAYFKHSGYNEWAETNRIVILYPTVAATGMTNPRGCWDWWGYASSDYLSQQAPQLLAIRMMVRAVAGR